MFAVVQKTLPGDSIPIAIDRDGDGTVDEWATHHLVVGAVGHTPAQAKAFSLQYHCI